MGVGMARSEVNMSQAAVAPELFRKGCSCSQAVLAAHAEGLGLPEGIALRIAAPFESGMGAGATCGAVTGALMVLGLRHIGEEARPGPAKRRVRRRGISRDVVGRVTGRLCARNCSAPSGKARAASGRRSGARCLGAGV